VRFTLRQMIVFVGVLSLLFALHTPFVRDLLRHEAFIRKSGIRPAVLARENYIFMLDTQPALFGLSVLDLLSGLVCWRRFRKTGMNRAFSARTVGSVTMSGSAEE
jgi:hypothetical protein